MSSVYQYLGCQSTYKVAITWHSMFYVSPRTFFFFSDVYRCCLKAQFAVVLVLCCVLTRAFSVFCFVFLFSHMIIHIINQVFYMRMKNTCNQTRFFLFSFFSCIVHTGSWHGRGNLFPSIMYLYYHIYTTGETHTHVCSSVQS